MFSRRAALAGLALTPLAASRARAAQDFRSLAPTPPMGWNSWDSFGPTIAEEAARANARILAERLLPHGYDVFTIDIQWYEPGADSFDYRKGAELTMDGWGRLLPAPNRFPSAAGGAGFKPLADFAHSLGLKFGLHMMRGVPRQAADRDLPIQASAYRTGAIADRVNVCPWNTDMYGIDMGKPGAQDYYDSVARLYASWGVDFVKADDMSRPYQRNAPEIHALRHAIDRCGRPMLLSLSPGETPLAAADDVARNANMWRISDDFWDTWPALLEQFGRLRNWSAFRRPGSWPDADMLPLGVLEMGRRTTRFTPEEQTTLMTLWCIARAPLIMGGDLRALDDVTLALLANDEVLAVHRASDGNRELFRADGLAAWHARSTLDGARYVALFNLRDTTADGAPAAVPVALAALGLDGPVQVRDLWRRRDLPSVRDVFAPTIPPHGAGLYRLSAA
ncbi:MAG: glycoside hydrolase family 27 protein [Rhizomicrobium sp.]